jgi:hypothetical protein
MLSTTTHILDLTRTILHAALAPPPPPVVTPPPPSVVVVVALLVSLVQKKFCGLYLSSKDNVTVFNWTMMVETMGRCDTPKDSIDKLLQVKYD